MNKWEILDIISVVNSYAVYAGTNRDNRPQKFDYCDVMLLKGERWYDFFESVKNMIIESDNVSLSGVKTEKI